MSFEFHESITLLMPNVGERFAPFKESDSYKADHKLIIEIAAIHAGLTSNYNMYSAEELEAALPTWVTPYPRPIILNHDEYSEPLGRVMASRMDAEEDGTRYVRLQVAILDPTATQKVVDERYLTGSVGGSAKSAKCSICGTDWAKANLSEGIPCRHQRGKVYEGKLAYFDLGEITFNEYSFVNIPADKESGVRDRTIKDEESADSEWTHTIKMYSLDMNEEKVTEMNELASSINVLESMKRKDARATYMNLKGTFLSVSAFDYKENDNQNSEIHDLTNTIYNELDGNNNSQVLSRNDEESFKENDMQKKEANEAVENVTEEEDILDVAEKLSADLADDAKVEEGESDSHDHKSDESDEAEESEELSESSDEETESEASVEEEESSEEGESAEEQLESETSSEEEPEQAEKSEDTPTEALETESDTEEVSSEESSQSDELVEEINQLKEENTRLRSALHRMLAERVVDTKIALGIETSEGRQELVNEHSTRTASSLADALKDLERLPKSTATETVIPEMEVRSVTTSEESNATFVEESAEVVQEKSLNEKIEDLFVDVFTGRKKLN